MFIQHSYESRKITYYGDIECIKVGHGLGMVELQQIFQVWSGTNSKSQNPDKTPPTGICVYRYICVYLNMYEYI